MAELCGRVGDVVLPKLKLPFVEAPPETKTPPGGGANRCFYWWAVQGSNLRPLPCEGSALPLS